ncbi:MAG: hypothetical protein NT099_04555 [Candidatus Saganbacteria bacterium]|nr:hypothetical protein [Candidatus Saganbacteria bacterium]
MDVKKTQPAGRAVPGFKPADAALVQERARAVARNLLLDWKRRPEPMEVAGLSDEDVLHGAYAAFGLTLREVVAIERSRTFCELDNLLPYLRVMVDYILAAFPTHRVLVLGRDAEPFYDALQTMLAGTSRAQKVHLVPGSNTLWSGICPDEDTFLQFPDFRTPFAKKQIIRFLSRFGITPEAFLTGEQFLVLDTGFYGTIAEKMVKTMKALFRGQVPAAVISQAVHPRIIGTFYDHPYAEILLPFSIEQRELMRMFPQTWPIMGIMKPVDRSVPGFVLALALQYLPKYHDAYAVLEDRPEGVFAVPCSKEPISRYIDRPVGDVDFNQSVINPVAAMLVQQRIIDYFQRVRQGALV